MNKTKITSINYHNQNEIRRILPSSSLLSSVKLGENNFVLTQYQCPIGEIKDYYAPQHAISVNIKPCEKLYFALEGEFYSYFYEPGDVIISPAGFYQWAAWNQMTEFLMLTFEPEAIKQYLYGQDSSEKIELSPRVIIKDGLIEQILITLAEELFGPEESEQLYLESLFNLLAHHLHRFHTVNTPELPDSFQDSEQIKLQIAKDYFYDRIQDNPSSIEIANILSISPSQLITLFRENTGLTPWQFFLYCKIERAKLLLKNQNLSLIEVSKQSGFKSFKLFYRQFSLLVGIDPDEYSQR